MLCRIKLNDADLKKYVELCSKKTDHINENLAGVIKHEHAVELPKYGTIINPYIKIFYEAFQQWYNIPPPGKLVIMRAWANFMVAGEFNPPHMHPKCDFSSVLFVKIPEELKEEHKKFKGTGGGPGTISFTYGEVQTYVINEKSFLPEEGKLFIFPASLSHFVSPFMCKGERVSISANFKLE